MCFLLNSRLGAPLFFEFTPVGLGAFSFEVAAPVFLFLESHIWKSRLGAPACGVQVFGGVAVSFLKSRLGAPVFVFLKSRPGIM